MATDTPVLDLNTVVSDLFVTIDGRPYTLHRRESLSLANAVRVERLSNRIGTLLIAVSERELSGEEDAELDDKLKAMCAIVVDAPPAVLAGLNAVQRVQITNVFVRLRPSTGHQAGARQMAQPTGGRSSRASRGSTAARRRRG